MNAAIADLQNPSHAHIWNRRRKRMVIAVLVVAATLVLTIASSAQAATHWYASGTATSEYQTVTSPQMSNVSGGTGTSNFGVDSVTLRVYMETYHPSPGYSTVGFATGDGEVTFHHNSVNNVRQYCFWYFAWGSGVSGKADMDCGAYR